IGGLGDAGKALIVELSTIWVPIQLGLIVAAAGLGGAVAGIVRTRTDLVTLTMGWPAPLRLLVRAIVTNAAMISFALAVASLRVVMLAWTDPARSALIGIATSL